MGELVLLVDEELLLVVSRAVLELELDELLLLLLLLDEDEVEELLLLEEDDVDELLLLDDELLLLLLDVVVTESTYSSLNDMSSIPSVPQTVEMSRSAGLYVNMRKGS